MANDRTTAQRARPLLAALACTGVVFAAAGSCGEGAVHYYTGAGDGAVGIPVSGGGPVPLPGADGGDGGRDGGDGGLDGGCVDAGQVAFVGDGCFGNGQTYPAAHLPSGCTVVVEWSVGRCSGTLTGPANAFDGGCVGSSFMACTGSTFPGRLTCTSPGLPSCNIQFCTQPSCLP